MPGMGNHTKYTILPVDFGGLLDHPVEELVVTFLF